MTANEPTTGGFMVFDVESIGLHGEGFAVGVIVIDQDGKEILATHFACPSDAAVGDGEDRDWVAKCVPRIEVNCTSPREVRDSFWRLWEEHSAQNRLLAADNAWPVEARFLNACVDDDRQARKDQGPYPFVDIGSVLLACDPDENRFDYGRFPTELPEHNPIADARRSARLLMACLHVDDGGLP